MIPSITRPKKVKKFRDLPEPYDIYRAIKGTDIELPVLLAMWLSFSISEIKGLTKSNSLSADGNYIMIREVMLTVKGKEISKENAKEYTRNRKHRIPEYIKKLINDVDGDVIVPASRASIYEKFVRLIDRAGLQHMTFHDLRHVNASVMARLSISDKYAQDRGGWASDSAIKSVYTETFSKERIAVDDTIDSYFSNVLFNEHISDAKYNAFLELFDLEDSNNSKSVYEAFQNMMQVNNIIEIIKMQHEMQHEKEKTLENQGS